MEYLTLQLVRILAVLTLLFCSFASSYFLARFFLHEESWVMRIFNGAIINIVKMFLITISAIAGMVIILSWQGTVLS